ncbi:unnamed protein product [Effrenium voratum]|uniref:Uncharacterized protein n=1 Tax=Effrenium voratum TaxID=2562239 RepID=A0AA36IRQ4_9DINO|nr:unnamed protein product [Effrenium voratum]CAJ1392313.1 unnamed protein product [Effrenium voratum]CAJ1436709.1 unnamed protein product [Effrenium voratum]
MAAKAFQWVGASAEWLAEIRRWREKSQTFAKIFDELTTKPRADGRRVEEIHFHRLEGPTETNCWWEFDKDETKQIGHIGVVVNLPDWPLPRQKSTILVEVCNAYQDCVQGLKPDIKKYNAGQGEEYATHMELMEHGSIKLHHKICEELNETGLYDQWGTVLDPEKKESWVKFEDYLRAMKETKHTQRMIDDFNKQKPKK